MLSTETVVNEIVNVSAISTSILDVLIPKAELIYRAMQKYDASAYLEVVLTITTVGRQRTPAVGSVAEGVRFLEKVGADTDIDTYRNQS